MGLRSQSKYARTILSSPPLRLIHTLHEQPKREGEFGDEADEEERLDRAVEIGQDHHRLRRKANAGESPGEQ